MVFFGRHLRRPKNIFSFCIWNIGVRVRIFTENLRRPWRGKEGFEARRSKRRGYFFRKPRGKDASR